MLQGSGVLGNFFRARTPTELGERGMGLWPCPATPCPQRGLSHESLPSSSLEQWEKQSLLMRAGIPQLLGT